MVLAQEPEDRDVGASSEPHEPADHPDPLHVRADQVLPLHVLADQDEPLQVRADHVRALQLEPHQQSPDHVLAVQSPPDQLVPSQLLDAHAAASQVSPKIVCSPSRIMPSSSVTTEPRASWSDPSPVDRGHVCTAPATVESLASLARWRLISPAPCATGSALGSGTAVCMSRAFT
jgi:hypothetical protein